jgi:hypothetical protein
MKLSDPVVQADWLSQHIPHRLRAALAQTTLLESMLAAQISDERERAKAAAFCLEMAAWEGRHAATRWLIEFVGINANQAGNPIASPKRRGKTNHKHDVDVTDLPGGTYFDLADPDAVVLGAVWKGCSQATSHATSGSNHPSIARDRISEAVTIVVKHLQSTAYASAGQSVRL